MENIRKLLEILGSSTPLVYYAAKELNANNALELKVHEARKLIRIFEEEGLYDAAEILKTVVDSLSFY